jgi:DNA-binding PadR family transcriptional regulator
MQWEAIVLQSVLDVYIVALLDRGFETCYDLQRRGGLSLGSTVPALRRLEAAGLVRKTGHLGTRKRPRNGYQASAAGRKLAQTAWIPLLKDRPPGDLDAVLRLADLAQHYGAKVADIASLFERAAKDREALAKQVSVGRGKSGVVPLLYVATRNDWDACRLAAENRFLTRLAKSVMSEDTRTPKRGLRQRADGVRR